jgi:hypothetical protein
MSDETESPPPMTTLRRRYPETPMPTEEDNDEEDNIYLEEPEGEATESRFFENVMFFIFVGIAIAHFWTVWALQADVNILMEYQKEHANQYKHMIKLLETMRQVKWQMVPAHLQIQ